MGVLVGLLLFATPFAAYGLWWVLSGQKGGAPPPRWVLAVAAVCVAGMVVLAFWYGSSRSIDRGEAYVPARIEGGRIAPGAPRAP